MLKNIHSTVPYCVYLYNVLFLNYSVKDDIISSHQLSVRFAAGV